MKKKLLSFIFAICLIIPAMFMLSACDITEDDDVQVRVQDGYVQWCTPTSDWQNIISIDEILNSIGDDLKGDPGNPGVNGKQVVFRKTETHIQWSYEGSENWTDLVALIEIKGDTGTGEKGDDGNGIKSIAIDTSRTDATKTTYVITFDDDTTYSYEVKNGTNGANGSVVTIGENGNWFIDGKDTGVLARGTNGNNGSSGSVVTIGEDGYWYIDGKKTDVKAKGEDGKDGANGTNGQDGKNGIDGREVEFQKGATHIQWRYVGETAWRNLVALSELEAEDGTDGSTWHTGRGVPPNNYEGFKHGDLYLDISTSDVYKYINWSTGPEWEKIASLNANVEKVTVNFDVNLPEYMYEFDSYIASNTKLQPITIDKGSWLNLETFKNNKLKNYFLGWYIGEGVDETKITSYTSINADCTLTAKWDYDKIDETYTSAGVHYRNWLNNTIEASLTEDCGDIVHIAKTYDNKPISLVNDFAYAVNTVEVILPGCASTGYDGIVVNDSTLETWNNTTLTKISWYGETTAEYIGQYSFYGCTALSNIKIPSSIKTIGRQAFENCSSLQSFDLQQVTSIGNNAFYNCTGLENINMWYVEKIGSYAFYNCSSLWTSYNGAISFYIPESVKTIGNNAFEGCTELTTIYINSTDIANLTNNDSYLFSYVNIIKIKSEITTNTTAYIDDSQGHFIRYETGSLNSHDQLNRVVE